MLHQLDLLEQRFSTIRYSSSANQITPDSYGNPNGNCYAVAVEVMRCLPPHQNNILTIESLTEDVIHFEAGIFDRRTRSIHTLGMYTSGLRLSPPRYLDTGVSESLQVSKSPQPVLGHVDITTDNIKSDKAEEDIREIIIIPQIVVPEFLNLALPQLEKAPIWGSVLVTYHKMTDPVPTPVIIDTTR